MNLTDLRDPPERPLQDAVDAALYSLRASPLLYPERAVTSDQWPDAARRWHEVELPALIAEGRIIRLADGRLRYA